MFPKSLVYYEARVVFGATALLPTLVIPVFAVITSLSRQVDQPSIDQFVQAFEVILPLAAGLSATHLMTIEREEAFDALRNSYPEPSWCVPVVRTLGTLWLLVLSVLLGISSFAILYGLTDFWTAIAPALPPALYLIGLVLLVGNVTQSNWLTVALLLGYWFMEYQQRGRITQHLFLFDNTFRLPTVSYALNRWLLIGFAALFIALNVVVSIIRRRGLRFTLKRLTTVGQ